MQMQPVLLCSLLLLQFQEKKREKKSVNRGKAAAAKKADADLAAAGSITASSVNHPGQVGNSLILHSVQDIALLTNVIFISWCLPVMWQCLFQTSAHLLLSSAAMSLSCVCLVHLLQAPALCRYCVTRSVKHCPAGEFVALRLIMFALLGFHKVCV